MNICFNSKNSLINSSDGGVAIIARQQATNNQAVLFSIFNIPIADLTFLLLNIVKILPEVKKNAAFEKECPIKCKIPAYIPKPPTAVAIANIPIFSIDEYANILL